MSDNIEWEDSTRDVFQRARQESAALGDEYIGTQHLLLALMVLSPLKPRFATLLSREAVLAAIPRCVERLPSGTIVLTPGCQTPRVKEAIVLAMDRARMSGRAVDCQDLWCGLLLCADLGSDSLKIMNELGVNAAALLDSFA